MPNTLNIALNSFSGIPLNRYSKTALRQAGEDRKLRAAKERGIGIQEEDLLFGVDPGQKIADPPPENAPLERKRSPSS
jgi:hypothetical protein